LYKSYANSQEENKIEVMVVSYNNKYFGLVVDKLLQQKEIVEKTLSDRLTPWICSAAPQF